MSYVLLIISVFIGALVVLLIRPSNKITRLLLSFSGAYLLSVTILHLLPEVFLKLVIQKELESLFWQEL